MNRIKQKRSFRFSIVLAIFFFISVSIAFMGCSGSGGSSAKNSGPSLSDPKDSRVSGRVSLGNVKNENSFVTGVSVKATPVNSKTVQSRKTLAETRKANGSYYTSVDSSGNYTLTLPPGEYFVEAAGGPASKAMGRVTLAEGDEVSLDFVLTATGNIEGTIDDYMSKEYVVFIPGTSYMAIPDNTGYFKITNIPVGDYTLVTTAFNINGYYGVSVEAGKTITVDMVEKVSVYSAAGMWSDFESDEDEIILSPFEIDEHGFFIEFSHPMDIDATESAISLSMGGNVLTDLDFVWSYDEYNEYFTNRRVYISNLLEKIANKYGVLTLTISDAAVSESGKKLARPFVLDIVIGEKIIDNRPYDGDELVYLSREIYDDMDEDDPEVGRDASVVGFMFSSSMDQSSVTYEVSPALENPKVVWYSENQPSDIWTLRGDFQLDTEYTVTITGGKTLNGRDIKNVPYDISFTTSSPKVVQTNPTNNSIEVPLYNPRIVFNSIMDRDTVEDGLVIKENGDEIDKENIHVEWDNVYNQYQDQRSYTDYDYWPYSSHDSLQLFFPITFGKTYEISINGAKTLFGDTLDAFVLNYTTMMPHLIFSDLDGDEYEFSAYDLIELAFNAEVSWDKSDFTLVSSTGTSVEFAVFSYWNDLWMDQGQESGRSHHILIRPQTIAPDTEYKLSWTGLEAYDMQGKAVSVEDGNLSFATEELLCSDSNPYNGSVYVYPEHRVKLYFNFPVEDEAVRTAIEDAVTITSKSPVDETHPEVQFLWNDRKDVLYVNFTMDFGTNYVIKADTAGNAVLESIFSEQNIIVFTTQHEYMPEKQEVFDRFEYNQWNHSLEMYFNACVWLTKDNLKDYVRVINVGDGTELSLENAVLQGDYSCGSIDGREYNRRFTLSNVSLVPGKTYKTEIYAAPQINPDDENEYNVNVPYVIEGTVPEPQLYFYVDNKKGIIEINGESGAEFAVEDIKNNLQFTPVLEGTWMFGYDPLAETPVVYTSHAVFQYKPVQYSNIKADIIASLPVYIYVEGENGAEGTYEELCKFADTPRSMLFDVAANLTPPEVTEAYTEGTNELMVEFNTELDSVEARKIVNYTITDIAAVTNLTIDSIVIYEASRYDVNYDNPVVAADDYVGPIAPFVLIKVSEKLESGKNYKVVVTPGTITEWGGNYPLKDGVNSADFDGYNGELTMFTGYTYNMSSNYSLTNADFVKFNTISIVAFDMPADTASVEAGIKLFLKKGGYYDDFMPAESPSIKWNTDKTMAALSYEAEENSYSYSMRLDVVEPLNNESGFPFDTDYSYLSLTMGGMTANLSKVDAATLKVTFYPSGDGVVDSTEAATAGNYLIKNLADGSQVMPVVTSVTVDPNDSNSFTLNLSADLVSTSSNITVKITGVTEPMLFGEGFTGLGSFYAEPFYNY